MKYMYMLLALVLCLPCHAGQREEALLNGLLGLGARALEEQVIQQPRSADPPRAASLVQGLTDSFKQTVDGLIDEYKEQYKEEGRAYAREVGNMVVERIREDPAIRSSITSLQLLCWVVIAYLTLVTLIMLACLVYLKRANTRLLAEVKRLTRRSEE